jgi:hypothetical protein
MSDANNPATPYKVGDVVQVEEFGAWYAADVLAVLKKKLRIHYRGWPSYYDEAVPLSRVRPLDAEETETTTGPWPLSGDGFGPPPVAAAGGRPVGPTTALQPGDRVQAQWCGAWYAAEVVAAHADGKVRVHFDGWDDSWDETLTRSSLRIEAPDVWEELVGKRVRLHLDGVTLSGALVEVGPDHLILRRQEDGKRLLVNRARLLYAETEE